MTFGKGWIFIGVITLCLGIGACTPGGKKSGQGTGGATLGDGSLDTTGFLATDFDPLNKWLDERFEVDYKHMTPELIFDQVPLNDIFYQTSGMPQNAPPFNFSSKDISRRELLLRVAQHWKLKMSLAEDSSGTPTSVVVKG